MFNLRTAIAAATLTMAPLALHAQDVAEIDAACGAGGSAGACADVMVLLPPNSVLRAMARDLAVENGLDINIILALVSNASNRFGVPGTVTEDRTNEDDEQSVQSEPLVVSPS